MSAMSASVLPYCIYCLFSEVLKKSLDLSLVGLDQPFGSYFLNGKVKSTLEA